MSDMRATSWKRVSWKRMKQMMLSISFCHSFCWGRPSSCVEDVVKSFELIVMPGLGDNNLSKT